MPPAEVAVWDSPLRWGQRTDLGTSSQTAAQPGRGVQGVCVTETISSVGEGRVSLVHAGSPYFSLVPRTPHVLSTEVSNFWPGRMSKGLTLNVKVGV